MEKGKWSFERWFGIDVCDGFIGEKAGASWKVRMEGKDEDMGT